MTKKRDRPPFPGSLSLFCWGCFLLSLIAEKCLCCGALHAVDDHFAGACAVIQRYVHALQRSYIIGCFFAAGICDIHLTGAVICGCAILITTANNTANCRKFSALHIDLSADSTVFNLDFFVEAIVPTQNCTHADTRSAAVSIAAGGGGWGSPSCRSTPSPQHPDCPLQRWSGGRSPRPA